MPNRYLPIALGIVIMVLFIPTTVHACPSCVEALEGSELGRGLNTSILFLLLAPFALVGSIGGWLFFCVRRHSRSRHEQRAYATANSNTIGEEN